jgi:hypothetical protein
MKCFRSQSCSFNEQLKMDISLKKGKDIEEKQGYV